MEQGEDSGKQCELRAVYSGSRFCKHNVSPQSWPADELYDCRVDETWLQVQPVDSNTITITNLQPIRSFPASSLKIFPQVWKRSDIFSRSCTFQLLP